MKLLFSEFPAEYGKYNFPYQVYGLTDSDDHLSTIYEMGFLPTRIEKNLFYLCRSLRIDLSNFELNSENRRVKRKTKYLKTNLIRLDDFKYDYKIGKMAKEFSKARFKESSLSPQITKALFQDSAMTHVLEFIDKSEDKTVGYCLVVLKDGIFHYSYPFYNLDYFKKNIGMGMIISAIEIAQKKDCKAFYLGTIYTKESMYKLQFNSLEFYTGFGWSEDIEQLKELIKSPQKEHLFKLVEDKKSFIKAFKDV
jgi:arginyl-tRNA--protein-N-Asp/Glu arginylyltransferase